MGTAKRRRVFESTVADEGDTIEFVLVLTKKSDGSKREETFETIGNAWAGADFSVAALIRWDDEGRRHVDLAQILRFFELVLTTDEQRRRFTSLLNDPAWKVQTDGIIEIYNWLVEEMAGRPTERSSTSSNGRPSTTDTSTGGAPPQESTSDNSSFLGS